MYSSESESEVLPEDDEEGKLYQLIYELTIDDKEPNAELQIPSSGRKSSVQVDVSPKGTVENGTVPLAEGHKSRVNDRTTGRHLHASVITGVSDQAAAERPWRAPGAVISDYFNYGFNEDSWRLYRKHGRFCAASGSPPCSGPVQEGRSAPEDAAPRPAPPGGPPRPRASRRPIDRHGTGGRAGRRGTVRGSRTLEDEGNDSQVYMSPDEDGFTFLHPSPPLDFSPVFAVVPPPLDTPKAQRILQCTNAQVRHPCPRGARPLARSGTAPESDPEPTAGVRETRGTAPRHTGGSGRAAESAPGGDCDVLTAHGAREKAAVRRGGGGGAGTRTRSGASHRAGFCARRLREDELLGSHVSFEPHLWSHGVFVGHLEAWRSRHTWCPVVRPHDEPDDRMVTELSSMSPTAAAGGGTAPRTETVIDRKRLKGQGAPKGGG
ncbi:uncharacterized protein fip1l1a isoform 4-T4 [Spinachia spinachia]